MFIVKKFKLFRNIINVVHRCNNRLLFTLTPTSFEYTPLIPHIPNSRVYILQALNSLAK